MVLYYNTIDMIVKLSSLVKPGDINENIINHNAQILYNVYNRLEFDKRNIQINDSIINYNNYKQIHEDIPDIMRGYNDKEIIENNIHFYFSYDVKHEYITHSIAKELFSIVKALYIFTKQTKKVYIYWAAVNKKRIFNYEEINKENIKMTENMFTALSSSGYTIKNCTYITRYEGVHKLLFHELIHNFNIDCHNTFHGEDIYHKHEDNFHYRFDIYESYTELLSVYLTILYFIKKQNISYNEEEFKQKIKIYIICEILYSFNVISNIISLLNYGSFQEFIDGGEIFHNINICVYEYYYQKSFMFDTIQLPNDILSNEETIIHVYDKLKDIRAADNNLIKIVFDNHFKSNMFGYCMIDQLLDLPMYDYPTYIKI